MLFTGKDNLLVSSERVEKSSQTRFVIQTQGKNGSEWFLMNTFIDIEPYENYRNPQPNGAGDSLLVAFMYGITKITATPQWELASMASSKIC